MNPDLLDRTLPRSRGGHAALLAALAAGWVLAGCGGGGSGGGGSSGSSGSGGSGGGGSSGAATSYYLSGSAGGSAQNIGQTSLIAVNPSTQAQSTLAGIGAWTDQASIGEWTAGSSGASSAGTRLRVFAGTDGFLHSADLALTSGSSAPAITQLTSGGTASLCPMQQGAAPSVPTVLNDYANPANSLLVYRSGTCGGSPIDQFVVVPLTAGASTAQAAPSLIEPVDAVHGSNGALSTLLLVRHSATTPQVAYASSNSAQPVVIGSLVGLGVTGNGGDFQSLAVVPQADGSAVWLWRDAGQIEAAKIPAPGGTGTAAIISVYSAEDTDTVLAPALVAGTRVYVALTDTTHPSNFIIGIDTTNLGTAPVTLLQETVSGGTGIQLVGVAGPNLVYQYTNYSALKVVATSATAATSGTTVWSAPSPNTNGLSLDSNFAPVPVGSGVYFSVTGNGTPATQAYYFSGTGAPVGLGSASQLLGGIVSAPMPIGNTATPVYGAALVAVFSGTGTSASPFAAATLVSADASDTQTTLGTLPSPAGSQLTSATLTPGLAQLGMPTLLLLNGYSAAIGGPATDLFQLTPGSAGSLKRITTFLQ